MGLVQYLMDGNMVIHFYEHLLKVCNLPMVVLLKVINLRLLVTFYEPKIYFFLTFRPVYVLKIKVPFIYLCPLYCMNLRSKLLGTQSAH